MHTNRMKFNIILLILVILAPFLSGSCSKGEEIPGIELPATSVLAIRSSWAVVTSTHLRLRERATLDSAAVTTLWKGSVLEVLTKTDRLEVVEGENDYWYQVNFGGLTGWVFGAYLDIFSSKEKAETASREIK
jgi:hypothetical protein